MMIDWQKSYKILMVCPNKVSNLANRLLVEWLQVGPEPPFNFGRRILQIAFSNRVIFVHSKWHMSHYSSSSYNIYYRMLQRYLRKINMGILN